MFSGFACIVMSLVEYLYIFFVKDLSVPINKHIYKGLFEMFGKLQFIRICYLLKDTIDDPSSSNVNWMASVEYFLLKTSVTLNGFTFHLHPSVSAENPQFVSVDIKIYFNFKLDKIFLFSYPGWNIWNTCRI